MVLFFCNKIWRRPRYYTTWKAFQRWDFYHKIKIKYVDFALEVWAELVAKIQLDKFIC